MVTFDFGAGTKNDFLMIDNLTLLRIPVKYYLSMRRNYIYVILECDGYF